MNSNRKFLIADTAFVNKIKKNQFEFISVFPQEKNDNAYRMNLEQLLERSKLQSAFYDEMLPDLKNIFKKHLPEAGNEIEIFIRPVLVIISSMFLDRMARVLHRVNQDSNLEVVNVEYANGFEWINQIDQNWKINQELIHRISLAIGLKSEELFEPSEYPEYRREHKQTNLLFVPTARGIRGIFYKIMNRFFIYLEKFTFNHSKFQNLGFGIDRFYFGKKGFFGPFGFFEKPIMVSMSPGIRNENLRETLFEEVNELLTTKIESFLIKGCPELPVEKIDNLKNAFINLFIDWFPTSYLEGLSTNLNSFSEYFKDDKSIAVIGHDTSSICGHFVTAVMRKMNKEVIGIQHGGHYGYIEDNSLVAQFEYPLYDKMITWGWTQVDPHFKKIKTYGLPIPKFSEKTLTSNYLMDIKNNPSKPDVTFFSNLFHRFPHISTCGQARVDFIDSISDSQEDLISELKKQNIIIKHKPYNLKYTELYPKHFERLQNAGGENYELLKTTHKGLSIDFIKTSKLIIWDQLGTGAIECFSSSVPTMVFWPRIYSREASWAKETIAGLEACGVIHRQPYLMALEVKKYITNPEEWMSNIERIKAIESFCLNFGKTDPHWAKVWRSQLKTWIKEKK